MSYPLSPSSDPFNPFRKLQEPFKELISKRWLLSGNNEDNCTQDGTHAYTNNDDNHSYTTRHRILGLNCSFLSFSSWDDLSQMQLRPCATVTDDSSAVHPTQEDTTTTIVPPVGTQQIYRLLDSNQHRPSHGQSRSDIQIALRRSLSSSSSSTQLSERSSSSLSQRDTKATAAIINPSVVKVPLSHYKTEYCTKFREFGQCPFGERCQFVHHESELQRRGRALTYKTRPCWSGSSCQYQKNHSRCVYLHGDETAEMFDEQRGISFTRVQKILAAKEVKQQHRHQQHQQQQKQQGQPQGQHQSSLLERSPSVETFEGASSREGGQGLGGKGWAVESKEVTTEESLNTPTGALAPRQQKTLQRSFSYPRLTPNRKLLSITPPSISLLSSNDKNNTNVMESTATATSYPLADLFSPGVMPFFETPFPSHDRIHEWKDPCFEDEDNEDSGGGGAGTFIQGTYPSSSLYGPPIVVPSSSPSSSSSSMIERLGIMNFFSDAFPTD